MTKTLTEQWRDGKLPSGLYYIKGKVNYDIALLRNIFNPVLTNPFNEDDVFEPDFVPIARVPSYDEYNGLKEDNKYLKSGIETRDKQIKLLQELEACEMANCEAQEIIACLEQQLQEANDLIMWVVRTIPTGNKDEDDFDRYIEKWGVK